MTYEELNARLSELEPDDYIVRVRYKYNHEMAWIEENEILTYNGGEDRFEWENDWHEGQERVELVGWIKVRDVEVLG